MSLDGFDEDDQFRIPTWPSSSPEATEAATAPPAPLADAWEPEVAGEWEPRPEVPLGDAGSAPSASSAAPPTNAVAAATNTAAQSAFADGLRGASGVSKKSEGVDTTVSTVPTAAPPSVTSAATPTTPSLGYGRDATPVESTIQAHGSGKVVVPPDCVRIDLGVETQGATLEEARNGAAKATAAFLEAIKGLSLPKLDLKTHQVSLSPVYEPTRHNIEIVPFHGPRKPPRIVGYRACSSVSVRLVGLPAEELAAAASTIVDTAAKSGANDIGGVTFGLDQPEVAARQALRLAVADARADAEALAEASGVHLDTLHSLCDHGGGGHGEALSAAILPAAAFAPRSMSAKSAETPIEAGDITVRRSVTARWTFR